MSEIKAGPPAPQAPQTTPQPPAKPTGKRMLTCTCHVRLSKDLEVPRYGVTPIEAMLLVAEHHRNVGASPINVKEITDVKELDEDRTEDQELGRLRARYGVAKVKSLLSEVRTFPTTFEDAIDRGTKILLPSSGALSTTKLI